MDILSKFNSAHTTHKAPPEIQVGWNVRVYQRIREKNKSRLQPFDGIVISQRHGKEPGASFTVRRVIDGIGVEKTYPLYSPTIEKIEVLQKSKVRRSKLYFLREKSAKQTRRKLKTLATLAGIQKKEQSQKITPKEPEKETREVKTKKE